MKKKKKIKKRKNQMDEKSENVYAIWILYET